MQPGDIRGKRTILAYVGLNDLGARVWLCRCTCGRESLLTTAALNASKTRGCRWCGSAISREKLRKKIEAAKALGVPWRRPARRRSLRRLTRGKKLFGQGARGCKQPEG